MSIYSIGEESAAEQRERAQQRPGRNRREQSARALLGGQTAATDALGGAWKAPSGSGQTGKGLCSRQPGRDDEERRECGRDDERFERSCERCPSATNAANAAVREQRALRDTARPLREAEPVDADQQRARECERAARFARSKRAPNRGRIGNDEDRVRERSRQRKATKAENAAKRAKGLSTRRVICTAPAIASDGEAARSTSRAARAVVPKAVERPRPVNLNCRESFRASRARR